MRIALKDHEEVVEVVRMYGLMLFPIFLKALILSLPSIYWILYIDDFLLNILALVIIAILTVYFFFNWICWRYNTYIITNQRILETKFFSVFTRQVGEIPLQNIKNMKTKVYGILPSVASFGTITIFTLSQQHVFLDNIPEPLRIQSLLSELRGKVPFHHYKEKVDDEL